ncbi:hypothetical protein [Aureliella helgolandensis]|uniref:Secreted protein n=1 Tax=Aureliella helgolandensis TaxID=2527968 RepID=A0A518GCV3_9BACT|nr:hypothetical protein [Aureliella helgolandensis]QDV26387.1 hypothetical protein Q31a_47610 [Aureliella helgolandensis]
MLTYRQLKLLALTISLSTSSVCALSADQQSQQVSSSDDDRRSASSVAMTPAPRAILVRVPSSVIANTFGQQLQHTTPVNHCILGTQSKGTAHCISIISAEPVECEMGASLIVTVRGSVTSKTDGRNGPAIIQSRSDTGYEAHKQLIFDGHEIRTLPATISTQTQVEILNIGSSLPGVRGRIVTRIASHKTRASHAEAEAIAARLNKQQLLERIDRDIDARVAGMNHELALKTATLHRLMGTKNLVSQSHSDCIFLGVSTVPNLTVDYPEVQTADSNAIELWVQTSEDGAHRLDVKELVSQAIVWWGTSADISDHNLLGFAGK